MTPTSRTTRPRANPDVVMQLLGHAEAARADLGDALTKRTGSGVREPGRVK